MRLNYETLLFVGLGNPGARYAHTRHNVGFWALEMLAKNIGVRLKGRKFASVWAQGKYGAAPVVLAMPRTYMNLSGKAVATLCRHFQLSAQQVWLIYDDMDLLPGRLRIRCGGSAGGHRGVRSVIESLGTQDFGRIRIGIGRPADGQNAADYVLASPDQAEKEKLWASVDQAVGAALTIVSQGPEVAMSSYN